MKKEFYTIEPFYVFITERRISIKEVLKLSGLTKNQLNYIFTSGTTNKETIEKLCKAFNLNLEQVAFKHDKPVTPIPRNKIKPFYTFEPFIDFLEKNKLSRKSACEKANVHASNLGKVLLYGSHDFRIVDKLTEAFQLKVEEVINIHAKKFKTPKEIEREKNEIRIPRTKKERKYDDITFLKRVRFYLIQNEYPNENMLLPPLVMAFLFKFKDSKFEILKESLGLYTVDLLGCLNFLLGKKLIKVDGERLNKDSEIKLTSLGESFFLDILDRKKIKIHEHVRVCGETRFFCVVKIDGKFIFDELNNKYDICQVVSVHNKLNKPFYASS